MSPQKSKFWLFFGTLSPIILHTKVVDQKFWVQKKAESLPFQDKLLLNVLKANCECCKWIHNITPLCTLNPTKLVQPVSLLLHKILNASANIFVVDFHYKLIELTWYEPEDILLSSGLQPGSSVSEACGAPNARSADGSDLATGSGGAAPSGVQGQSPEIFLKKIFVLEAMRAILAMKMAIK